MPPEIVTFGEAMVRLAPPHFGRLEAARTLDVEVGGAELNTAAGLVRLGRRVSWVSRLPANPLGRLAANRVREAGVDTSHVQFVADGRCGLYFLEFGAAPRASNIVYDRQDSSIARVTLGSFDWPKVLGGARWFHVTGITPALSDPATEVTARALSVAKALGLTTSIDLNYRSKLWSAADAGRVMAELLAHCDVLFASTGDAETLFGITGTDFADVAVKLCDRFKLRAVAGVKRETPLVWRNRFGGVGFADGKAFETPWYEVEIVDRLGAGDAFAAGVIHGLLDGDFEKGLQYGAAMGALKHTIPGDLPTMDRDEIEAVLAGHGLRIKR
ncbi:MAG: sugar kinase [Gemmataceae bacterium]